MSEKIPTLDEQQKQAEVRIEEANHTAKEFLHMVEHAFDGYPSEAQWQGEFRGFLENHSEYEKVLASELLNGNKDEMKARLLEDVHHAFPNTGGLGKLWLRVVRF